jgi:hypothetical protein
MKRRGGEDLLLCPRVGECNYLDEACGNDECADVQSWMRRLLAQFLPKEVLNDTPSRVLIPFFWYYSIQTSMKILHIYCHRPSVHQVAVLVVVSQLPSPHKHETCYVLIKKRSCFHVFFDGRIGPVAAEGLVYYYPQPGTLNLSASFYF